MFEIDPKDMIPIELGDCFVVNKASPIQDRYYYRINKIENDTISYIHISGNYHIERGFEYRMNVFQWILRNWKAEKTTEQEFYDAVRYFLFNLLKLDKTKI